MPNTLTLNPSRAMDLNGFSVNGAKAYFYDSGTDTPRTVYADAAGEVAHPTPLVADGAGTFPQIYDTAGGEAKVIVTTGDGVVLPGFPMDPVPRYSMGDTGAALIAFNPTPEIPELTTQAAIERVQMNIVSAINGFGIGITGNAPLLDNLDRIDSESGFYRYGSGTLGTFPASLTPATNGVVLVWRQSGGEFMQMLSPLGGGRIFTRARTGSAFESWRRLISDGDTISDAAWRAGVSTDAVAITPAALAAAIRDDRVWQSVLASRSANATYENTTNRTIQVVINIGVNISGTVLVGATAGSLVAIYGSSDWDAWPVTFDVPAGSFYRLNTSAGINSWAELR